MLDWRSIEDFNTFELSLSRRRQKPGFWEKLLIVAQIFGKNPVSLAFTAETETGFFGKIIHCGDRLGKNPVSLALMRNG